MSQGTRLEEASQFSDEESNRFFSRMVVRAETLPFDIEVLKRKVEPLAQEMSMNWHLVDSDQRKRVVLMCSKGSHCMTDLLDRWKTGDLVCDIACVISNHEDLRSLVEWYGIPFEYVPVDKDNKAAGFAKTEQLID